MHISDFDYDLPTELIAQTPVEPRDSSRLLVLHREDGRLAHRVFTDILDYLRPGDLLVANESRVLPARLRGRKESGGHVEALLLRPAEGETGADGLVWEALVQPGRRLREGAKLIFGESDDALEAEVIGRSEVGGRVLRFSRPPQPELEKLGEMPLPPYIKAPLLDRERYQTVYSRPTGSAAAPTAGLHFTPRLLDDIRAADVGWATVVLHVGLDTFRPIIEEDPTTHPMHREWYELGPETCAAINETRANGGRVIAVGTTTVRVLESVSRAQLLGGEPGDASNTLTPASGWTDLFIYPGFRFRTVGAMITNFHLPHSTLLMLVSAFAGREQIIAAYEEAVRERYRFFSFGDAMLII